MRILLVLICSILWVMPSHADEGAGLISGDHNGALPKDLWDDQKRSEIIKAIEKLPNSSPLKSVQQIKRDLLVSTYDTDDIDDDVNVDETNNFLTVRLQKLAQMGLWQDALKLYNSAVEAPEENEKLAQTGVTLTLLQKGLSTACLDAKVLKPYFTGDFWDQMLAVCNAELYGDKPITTQFGDSPVLKALYFEPDFKIAADNITSLNNMGLFEAAMAFNKQRIDYKNADLSKISPDIPLKIKNFFLKDQNAPDSLKEKLKSVEQAEIPEIDENAVTQSDILAYISAKLERNARINESDFKYLFDFGELYPENYLFLSIMAQTNKKYGNIVIPEEKINQGVEKLMGKDGNNVKLLHSLLDKDAEFSNNRAIAYEKQIGILLLSELSELSTPYSGDPNMGNTGDKYLEKGNTPLNRLRKVGLMQQAHLIARELLADLMQSRI